MDMISFGECAGLIENEFETGGGENETLVGKG